MRTNILFLTFLVWFAKALFGQPVPITRHEADSIKKILDESNNGSDRIDRIIRLAEFHMFKPGELKADLDSASNLIKLATQLNNSLPSREMEGQILLAESYLAKNEYHDRP